MEGDYYGSFWEGSEFWFTLAIPTIIWFVAFFAMLFSKYNKRGFIWAFVIASFALIFASNAIRRVAVELVRNQQLGLLETINDFLENGQAILVLIALAIAFFNLKPRAIWPLICALCINPVISYSLWLTNLVIWYGQAIL